MRNDLKAHEIIIEALAFSFGNIKCFMKIYGPKSEHCSEDQIVLEFIATVQLGLTSPKKPKKRFV